VTIFIDHKIVAVAKKKQTELNYECNYLRYYNDCDKKLSVGLSRDCLT